MFFFLGLGFGFRSVFGAFFRLVSLFWLPSGKGAFLSFIGSKLLVLVGRFSGFFWLAEQIFFFNHFLNIGCYAAIFLGLFFHSCEARKGAFFTPLCGVLFSFRQRRKRGLFFVPISAQLVFNQVQFWAFFGRFCRLARFGLIGFWFLGLFASNRLKFGLAFRFGLINNSANLSGSVLSTFTDFSGLFWLVISAIGRLAFNFRFLAFKVNY